MSKITIGVPVYNGDNSIIVALNSIASQSYADFLVIISDNSSTDNTNILCDDYIKYDSRFSYVRQQQNIGAFENFKYLVDRCNTEYFVFLAADDYWAQDFLKKNIEVLENDPVAVCSISKVVFEKNGQFLNESNGTFPIVGSVLKNLKRFLYALPNDNSRFYGIYRTAVLRESFVCLRPVYAADWYMMATTLLYGTHIEIGDVLSHREATKPSRYRYCTKVGKKITGPSPFALLPMINMLIKSIGPWRFFYVLPPLLRLIYVDYQLQHKYMDELSE